MRHSDWDIDFRDGYAGEETVAKLLSIDTVEVKTQRMWKHTGNLFIEFTQLKQTKDNWELSGILKSKATHYAFVLEELVLIVPTRKLWEYCQQYPRTTTNRDSATPGVGYLVNVNHLLQTFRRV